MESNKDLPVIDFNLSNRKKFFFFKRPKGVPIPVGLIWRCTCGHDNKLIENVDQFCVKCSTRLRLQENKEDASNYFTLVIVSHIIPKH